MKKSTRLIFFSIVIIGVLAIAGAGVWLFCGDSIAERLSRQPFDPVAWNTDAHNSTNAVRIRMVDDLLRRHNFRGMARDQVTAIIGEPDKTEYFKNWDMVYWLGPERGFMSIDSEWLVFRLDANLKVSDYTIARD